MPDVDRADQEMISNVLKGGTGGIGFDIDTSDPFAAIGSLESLFSDTKKQPLKDTQENSYSTLFGDAEKEAEEKGYSSSSLFNFQW